jgi:hypothetical protein
VSTKACHLALFSIICPAYTLKPQFLKVRLNTTSMKNEKAMGTHFKTRWQNK